jgi:hypothetical protein
MLTGGLNELYRQALATSHQVWVKVEVLNGQQQVLEPDLVFIDGAVSATLTSRISRTLSLKVAEDLYPYEAADLLAPYGNMIRASRGIEFADGSRFGWVVFVGRIQDALLSEDGTCQIEAADFAADVLENRFVRPENSQPINSVTTEVRRLISNGFSPAVFGLMEQFSEPVRTRTWQLDRGQALDELSTSAGAFWYALADGSFTLRRYPWTVPASPVVTYSDTGPLGTVSSSRAARSRADVFNSLTVTGERLNGDPAVYALAQDTTPGSATSINGNFGIRHQMLRLQTPGSASAAQAAASTNLRRLVALADAWAWSMSVDTALELGDCVQLDVRNRRGIIQVVAGMRIPLGLQGDMQVTGRSLILGSLEGVE